MRKHISILKQFGITAENENAAASTRPDRSEQPETPRSQAAQMMQPQQRPPQPHERPSAFSAFIDSGSAGTRTHANTTEAPPPVEGIIVFTDGSAKGNGSRHAKCGAAAVFPLHPEMNISYTLPTGSTNNRAEYTAVQLAIEQASKIDPSKKQTLHIYSDSKLLIDSMTKWISGWKRNGWRKSDGAQVLNQDLLRRIDELSQTRRVLYKHVAAHTGRGDWESVWNARADEAANKAAIGH